MPQFSLSRPTSSRHRRNGWWPGLVSGLLVASGLWGVWTALRGELSSTSARLLVSTAETTTATASPVVAVVETTAAPVVATAATATATQQQPHLLTLPGTPASHTTFLTEVTARAGGLSDTEFITTGFGGVTFDFPAACQDIVTWITQSSRQEQKISELFVDQFRNAVSHNNNNNSNKTRPLFVDVGSNCGFYSQLAAQLGMAVDAYDLQPTCCQHVATGASRNRVERHTRVYFAGMSDGIERNFEYGSSFETGCFGAFPARPTNTLVTTKVTVPLISLDERYPPTPPLSSSSQLRNSPAIAVLKADTEGNEIKVLQGALQNFRTGNIRLAILEFTPAFYEARGYQKQDAIDVLCQIVDDFHYRLSWHLTDQVLSDCAAITEFFRPVWEAPLSRDLLLEMPDDNAAVATTV